MCGRYLLERAGLLQARFGFDELDEHRELRPRFNIAPSQLVPVVVGLPQGRMLRWMRWGFRPGWLKPSTKQPPPINARAETVLERPLFRGSVGKARCLIPADGFYEWQAQPGSRSKQPFCIRLSDNALFGFAGLYTWARDERNGQETHSCAIITTEPNELMAPIHNRMPAILEREGEDAWLDPRITDAATVLPYLRPYPAGAMHAYPVAHSVSSVQRDEPALMLPLR